jgi:hypothetical protein
MPFKKNYVFSDTLMPICLNQQNRINTSGQIGLFCGDNRKKAQFCRRTAPEYNGVTEEIIFWELQAKQVLAAYRYTPYLNQSELHL